MSLTFLLLLVFFHCSKSVINITNSSPAHFVNKIRQQQRCNCSSMIWSSIEISFPYRLWIMHLQTVWIYLSQNLLYNLKGCTICGLNPTICYTFRGMNSLSIFAPFYLFVFPSTSSQFKMPGDHTANRYTGAVGWNSLNFKISIFKPKLSFFYKLHYEFFFFT